MIGRQGLVFVFDGDDWSGEAETRGLGVSEWKPKATASGLSIDRCTDHET
jgi:hypothetical protein